MQVDSPATERLSNEFRAISTKRKHGVLVVDSETATFEIMFQHGKIVFVSRTDESVARQVCLRLVKAGYLDEDFLDATFADDRPLEQLSEILVGEQLVSHDVLLQAITAYETDLLHSLRNIRHAHTEFRSKIVSLDPSVSLSLSPGQLLLDLVEITSEEERFRGLFGGPEEVADTEVVKHTPTLSRATPVAAELWDKFGVRCALADLVQRVLTSEHEVRAALLTLYDSNAIEVRRNVERLEQDVSVDEYPETDSVGGDLLEGSNFLSTLDEEFADSDVDLLEGVSNEDLPFSDEPEEEPDLENQLFGFRPLGEGQSAPIPAREPEEHREVVSTPLASELGDEDLYETSSLVNRLFSWNCYLREEQGLLMASTVITFFVLICVSVLLPAQVLELFDALVRFSALDRGLANRMGIPY
ncbi:MAG: DUF4388 domain-containing protein [Deltaproteobacteria bacterium]|nr:DUF4388 domain-containing protein [Deltaproteobacteria bacterium]